MVRWRGGGAAAVHQPALPTTPNAYAADSSVVLAAAAVVVVIIVVVVVVVGRCQGTATATAKQTGPLPLQIRMRLQLVKLVALLIGHSCGGGTLQQARRFGGQVETIHIHTLESIPAEQLVHGVVREFLEGTDRKRKMSGGKQGIADIGTLNPTYMAFG